MARKEKPPKQYPNCNYPKEADGQYVAMCSIPYEGDGRSGDYDTLEEAIKAADAYVKGWGYDAWVYDRINGVTINLD